MQALAGVGLFWNSSYLLTRLHETSMCSSGTFSLYFYQEYSQYLIYVDVFTAHEAYSYAICFLRLTHVSFFVPSIASLFVCLRLLYVYLSSDARDTLEECTGHLGVVCCCAGYISSHLRLFFRRLQIP